MSEPKDDMCPDVAVDAENVETVALYRRDFLRNASKIGIGGAIALFFGIGKFKDASADTCTALYETRPSTSCQTGRSCWRRYHCYDSHGIGYYTAWARIYCGSCGAPCPPNC